MLERAEVVFLSDSARCQLGNQTWDCKAGNRFGKGVLILSDSSVGNNSGRIHVSGSSLPLATNWFVEIVRNVAERPPPHVSSFRDWIVDAHDLICQQQSTSFVAAYVPPLLVFTLVLNDRNQARTTEESRRRPFFSLQQSLPWTSPRTWRG